MTWLSGIVDHVRAAKWALFWGSLLGLFMAWPVFESSLNPLEYAFIAMVMGAAIAGARFFKQPGLMVKRRRLGVSLPPASGASWSAIAVAFVMGWEGLDLVTAPDPIGVPTYCYGETEDAHLGEHHTKPECEALLETKLARYHRDAMACVHVPTSQSRQAAITSFSYNVGVHAFCHSTFNRELNAGDPNACNELLKWNKAGGIVWRGLTRRRVAELQLCRA